MKPFIQSESFLKLFAIYGGYCALVLFIHLMLTSVFSFFHFLLDHEMTTIENWLSLNGWEIIGFAKLISFVVMTKLIQVNSYTDSSFRSEVREMEKIPSKKAIASIFFLLVMFYSLLVQFGGGIQTNQILDELFFSSFLGSIIFYGLDVLLIMVVVNYFKLKLKHPLQVFALCLLFFLVPLRLCFPMWESMRSFWLFILSLFFISVEETTWAT